MLAVGFSFQQLELPELTSEDSSADSPQRLLASVMTLGSEPGCVGNMGFWTAIV